MNQLTKRCLRSRQESVVTFPLTSRSLDVLLGNKKHVQRLPSSVLVVSDDSSSTERYTLASSSVRPCWRRYHTTSQNFTLPTNRYFTGHLSRHSSTTTRTVLSSSTLARPSSASFSTSSVPQTTSTTTTTTNKDNQLVSNNDNNLPSKLIDFQVQAKIEGEESHVATIELFPGETLRAESGSMIFMTEDVIMDTKMNGASSAFNRFLTGQNVFLTDFRYDGTDKGTVCLGTDFPSKILRFSLDDHPNSNLICQRGAYLASNASVNIEMEFTKTLTAGFFGGQGFILQKLSGTGDVLVKGGGTIKRLELGTGETLRVSSGCIVAFESTVSYDVTMMPGIQNAMFGGEGLFITTLTGPGSVWLQGMPPDRMIAEIARRVPSGSPIGFGIPIGMGGGGGSSGAGDAAAAAGAGDGSAAMPGDEAVAAGNSTPIYDEAAIEADRTGTIASSGIDSDSPSALFGDAAADSPSPTIGSNDSSTPSIDDDSFGSSSSTTANDPFMDDSYSTGSSSSSDESFASDPFDEQSFASNGSNDDMMKDGELLNDDGSNFGGDSESGPSGGGEEGSQSIFQTLWDFFTGDD